MNFNKVISVRIKSYPLTLLKNKENRISNLDNLSHNVYNDCDFAGLYANRIEYNSHNALYERPAMLSLLPEVRNKKVLDAGCGPGVLTSILQDRGAYVTAIDYSDEMIRLTNERTDGKVKTINTNLNYPLDFLKDNEFDIIVSSLTIHYIRDLRSLFSEFNRVLKINGELIISTHHPFLDYILHPEGSYFDTELIKDKWPAYNIVMEFYRRPLSDLFNFFAETDFRILEMLEPLPVKECEIKYPDTFTELSKQPSFILFKTVKER